MCEAEQASVPGLMERLAQVENCVRLIVGMGAADATACVGATGLVSEPYFEFTWMDDTTSEVMERLGQVETMLAMAFEMPSGEQERRPHVGQPYQG